MLLLIVASILIPEHLSVVSNLSTHALRSTEEVHDMDRSRFNVFPAGCQSTLQG